MDGIIKQMKDILVQSNAGYVSVKDGKYTLILTDDEKGAQYLSNAWDEYAGLKEVIENDE